jgi:hypothetical protein
MALEGTMNYLSLALSQPIRKSIAREFGTCGAAVVAVEGEGKPLILVEQNFIYNWLVNEGELVGAELHVVADDRWRGIATHCAQLDLQGVYPIVWFGSIRKGEPTKDNEWESYLYQTDNGTHYLFLDATSVLLRADLDPSFGLRMVQSS